MDAIDGWLFVRDIEHLNFFSKQYIFKSYHRSNDFSSLNSSKEMAPLSTHIVISLNPKLISDILGIYTSRYKLRKGDWTIGGY